ncbi:MAG TPA: Hpt domain-containing protein [Opitutales bacterium]|nr:Hpt domain-containing protein [Opitutales bacterium]
MPEAPKIKNVHYDDSLPLMDREQIDMLLMADDEEESDALVRELFALFDTESSAKLDELDRICRERDAEGLRKLVHFIAGSAGNLGLARLSAFYRGIERAIDQGELEDFDGCAKLIPREFELSRGEFKKSLALD